VGFGNPNLHIWLLVTSILEGEVAEAEAEAEVGPSSPPPFVIFFLFTLKHVLRCLGS
jgi:hypothetical protein